MPGCNKSEFARRGGRRCADPATLESLRGVCVLAALIGGALGLLSVGLMGRFSAVIGQPESTAAWPFAGLLAGLSASFILPHRMATGYAQRIRMRIESSTARARPRAAKPQPRADRPLMWLVLAVTALAAGLLAAVAPILMNAVESVYAGALAKFVWMPVPLRLLRLMLILPLGSALGLVMGLPIGCVHRLACRALRWRVEPAAWLLAGGALAGLAVPFASDSRRASLCLVLAAVPMFSIAIAGVLAANRLEAHYPRRQNPREAPPAQGDRVPLMLPATWFGANVAVALLALTWIHAAPESRGAALPSASFALLGLATGAALACRRVRGRLMSGGAVGGVFVAVGLLLALTAYMAQEVHDAALPSALVRRLLMLLGGASIAACGYAATTCFHALLDRSGSRTECGARGLSAACACAALACLVASRPLVERLGILPIVLTVSWIVAGLGGALLVHERHQLADDPGRRRAAWLALTVLLLMTLPATRGLRSSPATPDNSMQVARSDVYDPRP